MTISGWTIGPTCLCSALPYLSSQQHGCPPSCRTAAFQVFSKETPLFESQDLDSIAEHDSLCDAQNCLCYLLSHLCQASHNVFWYSVCHLCSMCLMSMLLRISFYLKCVKHNCYQNVYLCYLLTNSMLVHLQLWVA